MSQYGAPSPTNAGTRYTPPVSVTDSARRWLSAAVRITPSPSRSHWMAAPAMNTLPSSAYVIVPPSRHAIVVSNPWREATGASPVLSSRKQPVPYVFLASPGT